MKDTKASHSLDFLAGSNQVAQLFQRKDWSKHPLGLPEFWPTELKFAVSMILNSQFPMFITWGTERTFFYNDAYRPILGANKHPNALGARFEDAWSDIWKDLFPIVQKVERGEASYFEDLPLYMNRNGEFEQTYFTFSYSPVKNTAGDIVGLFCACVETTTKLEAQKETARTQAQLEESRLRYKDLFDYSPLPKIVFDLETYQVLEVNETAVNHYGYSREEFLAMKVTELRPASKVDWFKNKLNEEIKSGTVRSVRDTQHIKKDGSVIDVEVSSLDMVFNGKHARLSAIVDITEKKKSEAFQEKLLRQSQQARKEAETSLENLRSFFLQSPVPMVILEGEDYRFTLANPPYEKLVGRQVVGKTILEAFTEEEIGHFVPLIEGVYKTGQPYIGKELPLTIPNEKGELQTLYVQIGYHPFRASDGRVKGIMATALDITEYVEAQTRLHEAQLNYERSVDMSPAILWITEENGSCSYLSKQWFEFTGQKPEETLGFGWLEATHPDDKERTEKLFIEAHKQKKPFSAEYRLRTKSGDYRWAIGAGNPRYDKNGSYTGYAGTVFDIHERKIAAEQIQLANRELKIAKEEAERANELKSAFLANMSHEIRTPLGAMMGFADLLKDPGLTLPERQSYTDILSRNGESLSVIINDILDLSKVEAGHLTLEYTDTFPDQVGADVVSLLRVKAREKDIVLNYEHDPTSPSSIVTDPVRVRQIVINLVSNAIKFTQFGTVNLKSFACKTERGRHALCFEVSDTGIGIPKHQHEKVFEMFVQADGSMTRRFGGTGLGLALSRRLARAMGGDVVITKSQEGVGSTFLVTIEDQPEKRTANVETRSRRSNVHEISETELEGMKILVVDDAPDNQRLIWRYLTRYGAVVESAENGLLGYRSAISGDFDLVLMDIQMPVMDGYSATQKLREAGYRKPIVAITAHAMNEVRKKALNVGYTDHLTKPLNSKELVCTVSRLVNNKI